MSEISFPVVNKPLSEDQWKTIAMGFGQGVIDRGGWPYLLTARDNVTNEVEIGVDQGTGRNEAILGGFVHRIDHAQRLPVPAVTTTTTYEVGLIYDPLNHGTEAGPVRLSVWTAPADYSQGKLYLVLYRITRSPNQVLTDAAVQEWRQRISTQIAVSNQADLPLAETVLVDTVALVRNGNKWMRSHKDVSTGTISWTEVGSNVEPRSVTATANTIPLRDSAGRVHSADPGTGTSNVVTRGFFDTNTELLRTATGAATFGTLPLRSGSDGGFLVVNPTHASHPTTKSYVDGKTWDAQRLHKTGNAVWWEIVTGSTSAYSDTNSTSTWATVGVTSGGKFFRYTSALKYKENIRPYTPDVDDALAIEPVMYDSKATGLKDYIGVVADYYAKTFPNLVQYGPDGEIEGWHYQLWPVVQQVVLRHHAKEIKRLQSQVVTQRGELDTLRNEIKAIKTHVGMEA